MAESLVHENLPRRVREVIVASDDVGDLHVGIVDHGGEIVGGSAVAAHQHEVIHGAGREDRLAAHRVVNDDVASVLGHRQTPHVGLSGREARGNGGGVQPPAGPVVAGRRPRRYARTLRLVLSSSAEQKQG